MVRGDLDDATRMEAQRALLAGMVELAQQLKVSSLHVTFPTAAEADVMTDMNFLPRIGEQYHWKNQGYGSFDDFLGALSSRKRKTIRKEREVANGVGVKIAALTGADIKPQHVRPQMGAGLPDTGVLRPSGAAHGRSRGAGDG
jgi:predicted N-acyltransferase